MASFEALEGLLRSGYERWRRGLRFQPLWAFLSLTLLVWAAGTMVVASVQSGQYPTVSSPSSALRWMIVATGPLLGSLAAMIRQRSIRRRLIISFQSFYREFADRYGLEALKNGLDLWFEESAQHDSSPSGVGRNTIASPFLQEAIRRNLAQVDTGRIYSLFEEWLQQRRRTQGAYGIQFATLLVASAWVLTSLWQSDAARSLYQPWTRPALALQAPDQGPLAAIRFTDLRLSYTPPSYTVLPSSSITYPDAVVSVPNGSRLTLSGTLSPNVALAIWVRRSSDGTILTEPLAIRDSSGTSSSTSSYEVSGPSAASETPEPSAASAAPRSAEPLPFTARYTLRERTPLVTRFDTLEFILQDTAGRENPNRFRLLVQANPDLSPTVTLLSPPQRLETDQVETLPITFTARDDHGLSQAELRYALKRAFVTDTLTGADALPTPARSEISTHSWDLRALRLRPRDELIYWIRVRDNDPLTGPKWGESLRHTLTVPSLADIADLFEESAEQVDSQLETLAEEQEAFAEELEDALRELQEGNQNTPQNRRRLNQLQEQREQVEQAVSEAREAMESLEQQMSQSDMLSEETRLAYKELQDLMQSLDSPELQQALQELQQALSQMNANQIQQAMEKLDFNEELYRKRLERTLDLFKTLNVQMQIEQMVKRYEAAAELAEKAQEGAERADDAQDAAAEKAQDAAQVEQTDGSEASKGGERESQDATQNASDATTSPSPEAARMFEELSRELEKIQELTQKLTENPPARRKDAIQNFQNSLSQQQTATQQELEAMLDVLQEARKQLEMALEKSLAGTEANEGGQENEGDQDPSQNTPPSPSESGSQAPKSAKSRSGNASPSGSPPPPSSIAQALQSQMQQAMDFANSLNQQQARVNLQAMQQVLAGLIQLSIDQETIARETETLPSQNPLYTDLAQRQRTINTQFSALSDSLVAISKEIPGLPDALLQRQLALERTLTESGRQLAERVQAQGRPLSRQAMAQINELALLTSDVIRQIQQQQQNGQGGGDGSSSQSSSGQGQGQGQMSIQQMIQNLQQMRGNQARLNQEMQNFVNDLQGDRLQSGQQARQQALDQFAKRQQELRRQLQELRRQGALPSGDRLQSEMERILEQMDRAIEDLRGGRTDDLLRQRQQNILSRMLTTESSLQTRGQEEERKGREARRTPVGATGLTTEQLLDLLRQQLDNPRYGDFTPEIKQQIEAYFSRVVSSGQSYP